MQTRQFPLTFYVKFVSRVPGRTLLLVMLKSLQLRVFITWDSMVPTHYLFIVGIEIEISMQNSYLYKSLFYYSRAKSPFRVAFLK